MADTQCIINAIERRRENQTYRDANTPRELQYYLALHVEYIRASNGDAALIHGAVLDIMAQCAGWLQREEALYPSLVGAAT